MRHRRAAQWHGEKSNPPHHVTPSMRSSSPSPFSLALNTPGVGLETPKGRKPQVLKQEDQGPGEGRGLVQVIQDRLCRSQGAYSWLLARGRGPGRRHPGPGPSFLPKAPTSEFPVSLQLFARSQACCPCNPPRDTEREATPSHWHQDQEVVRAKGVLRLLQPQLCPQPEPSTPAQQGPIGTQSPIPLTPSSAPNRRTRPQTHSFS